MALVASQIGTAHVFAFGRGREWLGASQFNVPVERATYRWREYLKSFLLAPAHGVPIIWISKGLRPTEKIAAYARRLRPDVIILLDLDDHDASLAATFRSAALLNRLKLHRGRRGHPSQILKSQTLVAQLADGFTFSTYALSEEYSDSWRPRLRVPHVRQERSLGERQALTSQQGLRIGALGTLRPHKGASVLLELKDLDRDLRLVTFTNCGLGTPGQNDTNWLELSPTTPLHEAYKQVDLVVIPMSDNSVGARFQLPAKLVDAMSAGVAVFATDTPAISEIAGENFVPIDPRWDGVTLREKILQADLCKLGRDARLRYEKLLTPAAAANGLATFLVRLREVHDTQAPSERSSAIPNDERTIP